MTVGIDGLVSGLDTTSLINSLMQVEAQPQTMLKNKVSTTQSLVSAFQSLNTRAATLGSLADATAKPGALDLYKASSSSSAVSVTVAAGASAGQIDLTVGQMAQRQVSVTATMSAWPVDPPVLTVVGADGTTTEVTAASTALDDVVTAFNAAGSGVTAMKVASGTDGAGNPLFRLQFSSKETGADAAFTVYQGSKADVTAGTATDLSTVAGSATIKSAQDATVTLWAGTAAEQQISSASNTFTDLFPGVSVTVNSVSATPVTLSIQQDTAAVSKKASDLVDSLNGIFGYITQQTATTTSTDPDTGRTVVTGGVLSGESIVRDVNQKMMTAATMPINGHSPSEIGISIAEDGTIAFDSDKFAAALAKDPSFAQSTLQAIAQRVADAGKVVSDQYNGTLTGTIKGQQSLITDYNKQISDWDLRLADQRTALEKTYATLEVNLSNLQSQSNWLTGQLAGLSTGG
ncbi:flagellar filament capping protein FliD [Microbacterium sp. STN6]|uniref:flagellar filament capping protein FliD n=1 Tax=Microbacterium sp. STN6 TaxID=2995588 RepID=UPI002260CD2C|nr:flagellar filament capping protein FliD [Microbacterium sp. STN6]MCX7522373.1 flagellar filament capping protein FliD [Microbacterium sp. STN6]